jgi:ATP-binding cassette subfamily A (ABC1) protein 3
MSNSNHFKALMKKNFIIWRRNWCCACLEIMIPAAFMLILVIIRKAVKIQDIATVDFTPAAIPIVPTAAASDIIPLTAGQQQNISSVWGSNIYLSTMR